MLLVGVGYSAKCTGGGGLVVLTARETWWNFECSRAGASVGDGEGRGTSPHKSLEKQIGAKNSKTTWDGEVIGFVSQCGS